MSMISPHAFIEMECKGKTYKELLVTRDELLCEIRDYEQGNIPGNERFMSPSPETVYSWNLETLGMLFQLIKETFEKEASLNETVDELIDYLRSRPDGYTSTTTLLLDEVYGGSDEFNSELMEIHFALFDKANEEGLELDMSAHEGKLEGLPYDLDFIVRKKQQ